MKVNTDSASAKGLRTRSGLGKTKHIAVNLLWVQDKVKEGEIHLHKIAGTSNVADTLTKYLGPTAFEQYRSEMGLEGRDGRHELAPQVVD